MSNDLLWNHDEPVRDLGIDVPRWIDQGVTASDIAAIVQGGCASGAYMPAVTYHQALATMNEYGDDVLDYISSNLGELPAIHTDASWAGISVFYLSLAVELWAGSVEDEIRAALEERAEEEEDEEDE